MGFQQRASQEQPVSAAPASFVIGWAVADANQIIEMLRKNVGSQVVTFNLVNATTGAALTGATVTTKVALDGTQSAGAGTVTELGTGQYKYVPTQGETNGASVGMSFTATNAIPVNLQCFTIGQDPTLATFDSNITKLLGTAWLTPGTAGTPDVNVKLWNALATVELPLVPTTAGRKLDVTATGGAGIDWSNVEAPTTAVDLSGTTIKTSQVVGSVSGAVGSVTGAVGSVTGNVGGNVTGSVGSVANGGIAAASFAAGAVDAAALASDAVTEIWAKACTEPASVVAASPTALAALSWILTLSRNKITQTATTQTLLADDAATTIAASTVADDGVTFSRGEFA